MGAITRFLMPTQRGNNMLIIPIAQYIDAMFLEVATAETWTIPTDCTYIFMNGTTNFYARFDGSAATVPSTEVADGTGAALNPSSRHMDGSTTISFISPAACIITIECFKG